MYIVHSAATLQSPTIADDAQTQDCPWIQNVHDPILCGSNPSHEGLPEGFIVCSNILLRVIFFFFVFIK